MHFNNLFGYVISSKIFDHPPHHIEEKRHLVLLLAPLVQARPGVLLQFSSLHLMPQ